MSSRRQHFLFSNLKTVLVPSGSESAASRSTVQRLPKYINCEGFLWGMWRWIDTFLLQQVNKEKDEQEKEKENEK